MFVGYSRTTLNYLERITLYNPAYMMIMVYLVAIGVKIVGDVWKKSLLN